MAVREPIPFMMGGKSWVLHLVCSSIQPIELIRTIHELYPLALNIIDNKGCYPIHNALDGNASDDVVKYLIDVDPICLKRQQVKTGSVPLHIACDKAKSEVVEYIVTRHKNDIEINVRDFHGKTPLHRACRWGYNEVVEVLLHHSNNDVDINARDRLYQTPFHDLWDNIMEENLIAKECHLKTIELLMDYQPGLAIDLKWNEYKNRVDQVTDRLAHLSIHLADNNSDYGMSMNRQAKAWIRISNLLDEIDTKRRTQIYEYCSNGMTIRLDGILG
jgi:ankyrin repeat protein